jgi:hypothetical protein
VAKALYHPGLHEAPPWADTVSESIAPSGAKKRAWQSTSDAETSLGTLTCWTAAELQRDGWKRVVVEQHRGEWNVSETVRRASWSIFGVEARASSLPLDHGARKGAMRL